MVQLYWCKFSTLWPPIEVEILFISILLHLHHSLLWLHLPKRETSWWRRKEVGGGCSPWNHLGKYVPLSSRVKYAGAKTIQARACLEVLLLRVAPDCEISEVFWCCFMFQGVLFYTFTKPIVVFARDVSVHQLLLFSCTGVHLILWWADSEDEDSRKGITVSVVHLCELAHSNVKY